MDDVIRVGFGHERLPRKIRTILGEAIGGLQYLGSAHSHPCGLTLFLAHITADDVRATLPHTSVCHLLRRSLIILKMSQTTLGLLAFSQRMTEVVLALHPTPNPARLLRDHGENIDNLTISHRSADSPPLVQSQASLILAHGVTDPLHDLPFAALGFRIRLRVHRSGVGVVGAVLGAVRILV